MAVASTRVGVHSSHVLNMAADGSSKIIFLQYLIISCRPAAVVAVSGGGGGGIESGEICPGGRTSCKVGGTAAARTRVNCSGEMRPAISAIPLAVLASCLWASARSEKIVEMREQVSLSGSFCSGIRFTKDPRMLSNVGMVRFSFTNVGLDLSGHII